MAAESTLTEIANSVRKGLNSASLCMGINATTSHDPTRRLQDIDPLAPEVDIVGKKFRSTLLNREGDLQVDYEILVGVRLRFANPPIGPGTDPNLSLTLENRLIRLCEQIGRYYFTHALPDDREESLVESEVGNEAAWEREASHEQLLFNSVITLTFRGFVGADE